jgi:DNA-binding XRE family transcriptional regulator
MLLTHKQPNKLVLYRRRMGFSQGQVSRLLGHRDTTMVSYYEHGRSLPPLPTALALEIVLRTPVAFLFPALYDETKQRIRTAEEQLAGPKQTRLF